MSDKKTIEVDLIIPGRLIGQTGQKEIPSTLFVEGDESLSALTRLMGKTKIPIRQSMAADAQECLRYFAFKYRYGLIPKYVDYSSGRETGTLAHLIVKELICGSSFEQALKVAQVFCDEFVADSAVFMENHNANDPFAIDTLRANLQKDKGVASAMSLVYWDKFTLDPKRWHPIAVELTAIIRVPGLVSPIKGTIDLLLWDREKNEIWIHDLKTTRDDPVARQAIAAFDAQTIIYRMITTALIQAGKLKTLAGEDVPTDTPVVGFRYNVIKRPTITHKKKWKPPGEDKQRPQSFEEYIAEVADWFYGRGEHADTNTGGRFAMPAPLDHRFTGPLIDRETAYKLRMLDVYSNDVPLLGKFFRTLNTKRCYGAYGNKPCEYLVLCTAPKVLWPTILGRQFIQNFRDVEGQPDIQEEKETNDEQSSSGNTAADSPIR